MDVEPSTSAEVNNASNDTLKGKPRIWKRYCCIPQCASNNRRNPELSFHKIPKNQELRCKWIRILKRKGVKDIGSSHRVCSLHFAGGQKSYLNNIPTIFTTGQNIKSRKTPTVRTFNHNEVVIQKTIEIDERASAETDMLLEADVGNTSEVLNETEERGIIEHDKVVAQLNDKISNLQAENITLQTKYNEDMAKLKPRLFEMERFLGSEYEFRFYTGFPNYSTFKTFFDYLSPACEHLIYHGSKTAPITSEAQLKCGRTRSMSPENELFLVLVRLRLGLLQQDIAHRFNISVSQVSRIFKTWIVFLHQRLRALPIWPNRKFIDDNMPECFKKVYPKTRIIIDCTELYIETPSSCRSQSITFSNYKHHNTAKGLIGISPNGYPSFVSSLYAGRTSDKKITIDCGILKLLEMGDEIMADRGFDIETDIPEGVALNIPPFLNGLPQLSAQDEEITRKIASVRVHVERAIARIKNYRILQHVIPISLADNLEHIWSVCCYLTLFLPPLIKVSE